MNFVFTRLRRSLIVDARILGLTFFLTASTSVPLQAAPVAGGEYFFGMDPGQGMATSIAAPAAEGVPSLFTVPISAVTALSAGVHTFSLRWKDSESVWGAPATAWIYKLAPEPVTPVTLTRLEYFLNDDPGAGQGTAVDMPAGQTSHLNAFSVAPGVFNTLADGIHSFSVRLQDSQGVWGAPATSLIVKSGDSLESLNIVRLEWEWWIGSNFDERTAGAVIPVSPGFASGEVPVLVPGAQLEAGQNVTVRAWWVDEKGRQGIPAQHTWTIEAHGLAWKNFYFSSQETALSGPDADPDGDGLPNLLELALGGNPRESASESVQQISHSQAEPDRISLRFKRIAGGATDEAGFYQAGIYNYSVEELISSEGAPSFWRTLRPQDMQIQADGTADQDGFENIIVRLPVISGDGSRLCRIRITADE